MRLLHVIRHASPMIQPGTAQRDWPLSERGRNEAEHVAEIAADWRLEALYTSSERKAEMTALIIGDALRLRPDVVDGFEELRIDEWIPNADAFSDLVRSILTDPDQTVRGAESASAAAARFASGLALLGQRGFPAAVVSHGRIIAAYLASVIHIDDPFTLWRSIPMPGWAIIDIDEPGRGLVQTFRGLPEAP